MTPEDLRAAYIRLRAMTDPQFQPTQRLHPAWDGGRDEYTGRRYQPIWPVLVSFAQSRSITDDPDSWVSALFEVAAQGRIPQPPMPSHLRSPAVVSRAQQLIRQTKAMELQATEALQQDVQQELWLRSRNSS